MAAATAAALLHVRTVVVAEAREDILATVVTAATIGALQTPQAALAQAAVAAALAAGAIMEAVPEAVVLVFMAKDPMVTVVLSDNQVSVALVAADLAAAQAVFQLPDPTGAAAPTLLITPAALAGLMAVAVAAAASVVLELSASYGPDPHGHSLLH